ncbi:MAG: S-adenosyl-L-methionine-dependent methyltransferase [Benniella sp.]|nr:MAG: S-adenosyl-L-methionine-dependent methyltransferase [Benniella sp.]
MSDVQALNNQHFNSHADQYDAHPQAKEMTERASAAVMQEFKASTSEEIVQNASVLEFGCGTGLCSFQIAPQVNQFLGLDVAEGMLEQLNHKLMNNPENEPIRGKVKTVLHQIKDDAPLPEPEFSEYLAGPNGGFDMIYSNHVMHHIEDVQGVVKILATMLKKDGWLLIVDFEPPKNPQDGLHYHHHEQPHDESPKDGQCGQGHQHHQHQHQHGEQQPLHRCARSHQHGEQQQPVQRCPRAEAQKSKDEHDFFKDESGDIAKIVPHKSGFALEEFEQILKDAGLVDVSVKHSYGMNHTRQGKQVWTDAFIAKGRRA